MPTSFNLTVSCCADVDASAAFYRILAHEFDKHRHGTGPEHYAASDRSWTFELYPASARFPATESTRIGFAVESCALIAERLQAAGFTRETLPTDSHWGRRAVAIDPDGPRVEIFTLAQEWAAGAPIRSKNHMTICYMNGSSPMRSSPSGAPMPNPARCHSSKSPTCRTWNTTSLAACRTVKSPSSRIPRLIRPQDLMRRDQADKPEVRSKHGRSAYGAPISAPIPACQQARND